ncbi:sodium/hydrogen exchanger 8-like [Hyalella azteca]|uniref:Sodium/hydrogen exchanger n=1 Tax=Hyalella azteca TaxID=294128 RepID=A0A8B7PLB0_HYAAZ|nr:sodium/hydrogen exchanger 8-like [Hyalella azteca]
MKKHTVFTIVFVVFYLISQINLSLAPSTKNLGETSGDSQDRDVILPRIKAEDQTAISQDPAKASANETLKAEVNINTLTNNQVAAGNGDPSLINLNGKIPSVTLSEVKPELQQEGILPQSIKPNEGPIKSIELSAQQQHQDNTVTININSQLNNGHEQDTITTAPSQTLVLKVGNTTLGNACLLSKDSVRQLVQYYPQHCLPASVDDTERNEFIGNLTDSCNESEDLPAVGAAEKEHLSSLSIFLILCILGLCVLLIFFMLKTKLHYLPESVACVIVGAFIGLVLKILSSQNIANFQKEEAFSPTIFFLVFLPPIIFESGYNLHKGNFFQNIGSILVFAILGTIVSALVIGGGIYLLGKADVVYQLTFVESFAFGSLISAVDPVATLALFNALQVDPILYMLVFGESILNDAVAIVLTTSVLDLASYGDMSPGEGLLYFVWRFCLMFLGSAGIGVFFGLLSAITLKHIALRDYTSLELCILIIFIYAPYALAEGIHLSGIMAILFCGVVMSHYTHYNLSPVLQITVQHLMRTLAFTSECIVFIYLGMALFSFQHQFQVALLCWSIVLCLVARACNIFPLACLVNKFRDHPITPKMMFVMWFSGLRGAIAYALSLHLEFSDEKRRVLVTTALFIVLFTIFILGGSVVPLIKYVEVDAKKSIKKVRKKKTLTLSKTREWGQAVDSEHMSEMTEEESSEGPRVAILNGHQQLGGFLKLDKEYLRPFFCRNLTHQEVRSHAIDLKRQCYQSLNVVPSDSEDEMINI